MNTNIGILSDLYNRLYLIFGSAPRALTQDQLTLVDQKVQEVVADCELKLTPVLYRDIKVRIIKAHKTITQNWTFEQKIVWVATKIYNNFVINSIPSRVLLAENKEAGLNFVDNHNKYSANPDLKNLAQEIDQRLTKNLTMREFAKLIVESKEKTNKIVLTIDSSAGTDELTEASLFMVSMQKNDRFLPGVKQLNNFAQTNKAYAFLHHTCLHYLTTGTALSR